MDGTSRQARLELIMGPAGPRYSVERVAQSAHALSLEQESTWQAAYAKPELGNLLAEVHLTEQLDATAASAIRAAMDCIVARHEILRTGFRGSPNSVRMVEVVKSKPDWTEQTLSSMVEVDELLRAEAS